MSALKHYLLIQKLRRRLVDAEDKAAKYLEEVDIQANMIWDMQRALDRLSETPPPPPPPPLPLLQLPQLTATTMVSKLEARCNGLAKENADLLWRFKQLERQMATKEQQLQQALKSNQRLQSLLNNNSANKKSLA